MRRLFILSLVAMTLPGAACFAAVMGGHHNFGGTGSHGFAGLAQTEDRCQPCHIPHHAFDNGTLPRFAPLWNHNIDSGTTFSPYVSPTGTFTGTFTNGGQPNSISLLCLSCHDGVMAEDQFGVITYPAGVPDPVTNPILFAMGDPGNTGNKFSATSSYTIGTDLTRSHPFSFIYDSTLAANHHGINDPTTTPANLPSGERTYGGTIATDMLIPRGAGTSLECVSCHEIHGAGDYGNTLLIKDNASSALCTTCHN